MGAGLEYKFMVKSVDPDGTKSVPEEKSVPPDVVIALSRDFHEQGVSEDDAEEYEYEDDVGEVTSPAPEIPQETRIQTNHTGKKNHFSV